MKRITTLLLLLACLVMGSTVIPATGNTAGKKEAGEVIIYNWSEFIPQDVLDDFTKETGIKVVYSTFESNEAMYAKVRLMRGKGYDIIVPSGYFIDLMVKDKLLQKIDKSKLTNLANIDPQILSLPFDPQNEYSVPYMCGTEGLAYNTKYIPKGSITKWTDLLRPEFKGKIIITDDLRDAFGTALKAKGYSSNTSDPKEIEAGYEFLKTLKPSIRVFDVSAIKQTLITEEVWLGTIWNGDYLVAKEENEHLEFILPEEGFLLWVDSFAIPAGAANVDNAHTFINFMLRPDIAKRCIEEYKYTSPNLKAKELLSQELQNNHILFPSAEEMKKGEYVLGLGEALALYEKFWELLKTLK